MGAAVDADLRARDELAVLGGQHRHHAATVSGPATALPTSGVWSVGSSGSNRPNSEKSTFGGSRLAAESVMPLFTLPGAMLTARRRALYAAMYGWANEADVELKLTTTPAGDRSRAARVTRNVPVRFTASTRFHSSSDVSCV